MSVDRTVGTLTGAITVLVAHGWTRAAILAVVEEAINEEKAARARPDYDPKTDWPERYQDGPIS